MPLWGFGIVEDSGYVVPGWYQDPIKAPQIKNSTLDRFQNFQTRQGPGPRQV